MAKIRRNAPCPCGSGKKFKHCHGSPTRDPQPNLDFETILKRADAMHVQRRRQQGFGRPIVSGTVNGHRLVAVKNRLLSSQKWRTFHDFLNDYMKAAMGNAWGRGELAKPLDKRHPILIWHNTLCMHQKQHAGKPGEIFSMPMTGAIGAYMHLAYDLYELDHNVELQSKLIKRLQDKDNFYGARYEVFVAATLIRAGFLIEFENEDSRKSTHCEFTATFPTTSKQFSVEAKYRAGGKFRLGRLFIRALKKHANHQRIIFMDINLPDDNPQQNIVGYLENALSQLKRFEGRKPLGKTLPNSYIVLTNTPWHHNLESQTIRCTGLMDGFQISDFKRGQVNYPSLRAAINTRNRHIEMETLLQSMNDHYDIPSTFNGEIPELAYDDQPPRLLIGKRYAVTDDNGDEKVGLLTNACVLEDEKKVYGVLHFENDQNAIYSWPLTDTELAAWRRYPDTFFGVLEQRKHRIDSPLEAYDFFYNSYKNTSRERLLELMKNAPDIDHLRTMDQKTLADIYAERCANSLLAMNPPKK